LKLGKICLSIRKKSEHFSYSINGINYTSEDSFSRKITFFFRNYNLSGANPESNALHSSNSACIAVDLLHTYCNRRSSFAFGLYLFQVHSVYLFFLSLNLCLPVVVVYILNVFTHPIVYTYNVLHSMVHYCFV
jgi:Na+/melibiose symporter-like transporter